MGPDVSKYISHLDLLFVHHLPQLIPPVVLVVSSMCGFFQVLHVVGQHKVSQGKEVTVALEGES